MAETYEGSPCRRFGHTERYVNGGSCAPCGRASARDAQSASSDAKRERYKRDPEYRETVLSRNSRWRADNVDRVRDQKRQYRLNNLDSIRDAELRRKYGISLERYREMLESQGSRCAICEADSPGGQGSWHVDHDHETGTVRGLLCSKCNPAIGALGDSLPGVLRAAIYLAGNEANLVRFIEARLMSSSTEQGG